MNKEKIKTATTVISDVGYPIPIEMRPIWRTALICIAINIVDTNGTSLKIDKLRIFIWMLARPTKWDNYYYSLHSIEPSFFKISSDKSTDIAIEIAIVKGFVKLESDSLHLEHNGLKLLMLVEEIKLFKDEIDFLQSIKSKVTDKYIKSLIGS